jgi:predicted DNA-binding transcriptional regulator YafY
VSYKFDSLIQILNILDRKEKVTVQSLMDDLRIAERSVYRYITTLRNADIPITYDREKGTYAFDQGYSLSRPDLSTEEILAFSLARKLLGNLGPGMGNTLDKMQNKLSIKKTEPFKHIVIAPEEMPEKVGLYLVSLHQAAKNFQRIDLVYKALYSDEMTKRQVDPYYLFFQEDFWYFRGYCHLRKEFRTFALDRIASMKLLDHYFVPQRIPAEEEIAGTFGSYVDGDPVEVVLRFDEEIKPHVLRRKWHNTQRDKALDDGRLEFVFTVNGLEGIKQWIYKWLPHVEVVSPQELRDILIDDLTGALAKHNKPPRKMRKEKL